MSYTETNQLQTVTEYEVIIVGAGVAGVSAALAAARLGKHVLLVEKSTTPGGLATAGLVAHYLPLCDGLGRMVTGGNAERLLHLAIKYGYSTLPQGWEEPEDKPPSRRYQTWFSPAAFVLALEEELGQAGVDILYDAACSRVAMDDSRCRGVILDEGNYARRLYTAPAFVDATGDGALFAKAGATMVTGCNRLAIWDYTVSLDGCRQAVATGNLHRCFEVEQHGQGPVGTEKGGPFGDEIYRIEGARDLTEFVLRSRQLLTRGIDDAIAVRKVYMAIPSMPNLRKIRRIRGRYTLVPDDVLQHFADSIGCISDWRKSGLVYEVPYRTLIATGIDNILAAGRCTAAADDAWELARCIPQCALTGKAAGTAAALVARGGSRVSDVPIGDIQALLAGNGVLLHYTKD